MKDVVVLHGYDKSVSKIVKIYGKNYDIKIDYAAPGSVIVHDHLDLRQYTPTRCTARRMTPGRDVLESPGSQFTWLKDAECGILRSDTSIQGWGKDDVSL